jgi:glycosyltransferase involved in cell wall biosynthesis
MPVAMSLGFVVIGRNEGDRLRRCLESLSETRGPIVYVDSGSVDQSISVAAAAGAVVINLDTRVKFSAARARNAGFRKLREIAPAVEFVQFVDGDCEVAVGWPELASRWLVEHEAYALASGRRRERFPENSVYNYLCEIEWQTPVGDALECGGDAMIRVVAFEAVGGYRDSLIAGEEPELCFRLRQAGWRIRKLDAEMGLHDASMFRFAQWWKRSRRCGFAYAEGAYLHGRSSEAYCVRSCVRILFWAGFVPVSILLVSAWTGPVAAWALLIYPAQIVKVRLSEVGPRRSWRWSAFVVFAKFPELQGLFEFLINRLRGRDHSLIEYK